MEVHAMSQSDTPYSLSLSSGSQKFSSWNTGLNLHESRVNARHTKQQLHGRGLLFCLRHCFEVKNSGKRTFNWCASLRRLSCLERWSLCQSAKDWVEVVFTEVVCLPIWTFTEITFYLVCYYWNRRWTDVKKYFSQVKQETRSRTSGRGSRPLFLSRAGRWTQRSAAQLS